MSRLVGNLPEKKNGDHTPEFIPQISVNMPGPAGIVTTLTPKQYFSRNIGKAQDQFRDWFVQYGNYVARNDLLFPEVEDIFIEVIKNLNLIEKAGEDTDIVSNDYKRNYTQENAEEDIKRIKPVVMETSKLFSRLRTILEEGPNAIGGDGIKKKRINNKVCKNCKKRKKP